MEVGGREKRAGSYRWEHKESRIPEEFQSEEECRSLITSVLTDITSFFVFLPSKLLLSSDSELKCQVEGCGGMAAES